MTKKILLLILLGVIVCTQVTLAQAPSQDPSQTESDTPTSNVSLANLIPKNTLTIENEFLRLIVNKGPIDQGRFAIETTFGDPQNRQDDFQPLIFGRPIPWTSYTTLLIDGKPYIFGGVNKTIEKRSGKKMLYGTLVSQEITESGIVTICNFGDIDVVQTLSFSRNPSTKVKDTAKIHYDIINKGPIPHRVGLRLMMDTKLGENDGAPFRIGDKAHEAEIKFVGNDIYDYWQTFDNLSTPNVIAQGTIRQADLGILPPDRMYLANWGTLVDHPWEFKYQENRPFIRTGELEKDTALALYWDAQQLQPSTNREVKTLYGLAGVSLAAGQLSLGLSAPAEIYATSKKDILVMGYIHNSGGFDSHNTTATFEAPKGLTFLNGTTTFKIGTLKAGDTTQIPIRLRPTSPSPGLKHITFKVKSESLDPNKIKRAIDILAPPSIAVKFEVPELKLVSFNPFVLVKLTLENPSTVILNNIKSELKFGPALSLPSFEIQSKEIEQLVPNEPKTISWLLKLNDPSLKSVDVESRISSAITKPSRFKETITIVKPDQGIKFKPSIESITKDDYFYTLISVENAQPYENLDFSVTYDKSALKYLRYSPEQWILNSGQRPKVFYDKNEISLEGVSNPEPSLEQKILKLHFKAKDVGPTTLTLTASDGTQVDLDLTIQPNL